MSNEPARFIWYELMTTDLEAAASFYAAVLGWSLNASGQPGPDYRQWSMADVVIGGAMAIPAEAAAHGMQPAWLGYLYVPDVDAALASITAAGGAVHKPAWDVPGVGRIAMVSDPQGAAFYVMTPRGEGPSPSFAPERVGHGGWNELHTSDWRAALAFYEQQFGWEKVDAVDMGPMGTYLLFGIGGDRSGGMMESGAFPRPAWLYYFNVDDIHAAHARLTAAGGAVLNGPHQVPGGNWILQARDPQGAHFALMAPGAA